MVTLAALDGAVAEKSLETQLAELQRLRDQKLLTEEEYNSKRSKLVAK